MRYFHVESRLTYYRVIQGFSPPFEDTSTLVLKSTQSGFVDIRFPTQPDMSRPLCSNPSFWAFSGTSTTTFAPEDKPEAPPMPYSAHCVWKHEIDSKGPGIGDEGDMFILPNGDCIEVGMMANPSTQRVELYKEYWTTPEPAEPGSRGEQLPRTPCVVAKTLELEPARNGSGVVIRVGDYCQGIVQRGGVGSVGGGVGGQETVLVERWCKTRVEVNPALSLSDSTATSKAEWLKDWRSNTPDEDGVELSMPCKWLCEDGRKLGDQIVVHGVTWSVVEEVK